MNFLLLAAEGGTTVVKEVVETAQGGTSGWTTLVAFLVGVVLARVAAWASQWFEGKGAQLVQERLKKFEEKLDNTSVGAQIQADNYLFKIAKGAIPEVMTVLAENVRKDLEDGKFDKVDWDGIGGKLWAVTKDHVQGGANDYIKNSSFADGQVAMAWIAKKLFHEKVEEKNG